MTRVGIFGGSFDPIHTAHLVLAEKARTERCLDEVLFIPARQPPHKPSQALASADHRLRMIELAIADSPACRALCLELERQGPSYTLLTVRQLRQEMGSEAELFLILGGDSLREMPSWWRADELVREIEIISFDRPGHPVEEILGELAERFGEQWARRVRELRVQAPLQEISATHIRERVRSGKSIRNMVPDAVRQYIAQHGLYGAD